MSYYLATKNYDGLFLNLSIPDIVQVRNPKTSRYIKIDRTAGNIIGQKLTKGPYKKIPIKFIKNP